MPITATYAPATFTLTVTGTTLGDAMTIERDVAGALRINGGTIAISGGAPTVANTDLIAATGGDGNDVIAIDETNGAMPKAELVGGNGDDTLTGGSGNDVLTGEANNDTLFGRAGIDLLFGGADNDALSGGDGNDQMFGEAGNDRMIWNPGDDNDLMEGGDGSDIAEVNGGNGAEVFTITANGTRVRFDRVDPAPFNLDIGTTEILVLSANGGDDQISATGNLAALINLTIDGGAGNDTILGGNGADTLFGGDDNDFIDGNQGNDTVFLGAGNDIFNWDPGDGSDVVEGQAGTDLLVFNGNGANESFTLSANGTRGRLFRDVAAIVMDLNEVEQVTLNAGAGGDTINIDDLSGTAVTQATVNLAATIGGTTGDGAVDQLNVTGSANVDTIDLLGISGTISVLGLSPFVSINQLDATDRITISGGGGNDVIRASQIASGIAVLTIDGGTGNDTIEGSAGADTILGGDGDDVVDGNQGTDTIFLGIGNDIFNWNPGDASDLVEGGAGTDELRFNGSNANENINIVANGARLAFLRDVAAINMDLDDIERIRFTAIGGTDNITVGDLTGTDATLIDLRLGASGGGGDGVSDTVTVNGTGIADIIVVNAPAGVITAAGLAATVTLTDAEGANDRLTINANGGDDVIDASSLAAGLIQLSLNGGLGSDVFFGSAGNDLVTGGDGNDTALLGAGNDLFTWNPGDDNDTIEGQSGTDTLQFNGANIAETITISANGVRALFFRDVAAVTMDLNDTEVIRFAALGGIDTITVNDLAATDVTDVVLDLASTIGGASGDGQADLVTLNGSGGANLISLSGTGAALIVTGLPWTATLNQIETADRLTILAGEGNDTISTAGIANQLVVLTLDGGGGNDVLFSTGDGTCLGGSGDDLIFAGLTNASEVLDGGIGIDTLDTTSLNSTYTVNLATGLTSIAGESFLNFENLTTGNGADTVIGTIAANIIRTNGGSDNVSAGDGDDLVEGGASGDTLDGGVGFDTLDYSSSNAGVTVSLNNNSASGGHATGDIISNFENLTGSALTDSLTGNAGANVLNGGAGGADILVGLGGGDTYIVDGDDIVVEAAGGGTDQVRASASYALGAGVEVETLATVNSADTAAIGLTGNEFGQTITGNAGNNFLDGGGGTDILQGLGGNDTYIVDSASDQVLETIGGGNDLVAAKTSYALSAGTEVETLSTVNSFSNAAINLTGNEFGQTIIGNAGTNILNGGAGNDTVEGGAGADTLDGGADIDTLDYSSSNAAVTVSLNNNSASGGHATGDIISNFENLSGSGFADSLSGNAGANVLNGGAGGADILVGLGGGDTYVVDGDDIVVEAGGGGNDLVTARTSYALNAGAEVETLSTTNAAGTGAIGLTGNEFAQTIIGNAGNNFLDGGGGADILNGGAGNDVIIVDSDDQVVEAVGGGNDLVAARTSYALNAGAEVETLSTINSFSNAAIGLTGNAFGQTLIGNAGANFLDGGGGADILNGGAGNDVIIVDADDQVVEAVGGGNDLVAAKTSYALNAGAEVETLSTINSGGNGAIGLTGNEFAQTLIGNAGNNFLDGGGGADILQGLGGNDTIIVDSDDLVVEAAGGGNDLVAARTSYALNAGAEVETLSTINSFSNAAIGLTGNEFAQTIIGNAGANFLDGGGGADILNGGAGNDTIIVDSDDLVVEAGGGGNDLVAARTSYALNAGAEVETLSTINSFSNAAIGLTGNAFAQTLIGNVGNNFLDGGGGADILNGGGGNDTIIVDSDDQVIEAVGGGNDLVAAKTSYALNAGAEVETLSTINSFSNAAIGLTGNEFSQTLIGNIGNNFLDGGGGADVLNGGAGNDTYIVDNAGDQVVEAPGGGNDLVASSTSYALNAGAEVETLSTINSFSNAAIALTGNEFAQTLIGNAGNNVLNGGLGADTLQGLGGADSFAFTTALGGGNVDAITDFAPGVDKIALDDTIFGGGIGTPGAFNANAFFAGSAAHDADDRIIYDSATGQLFFDADGIGGTAQVLFATLQGNPALAAGDFAVI